jgi:hypothetical protein
VKRGQCQGYRLRVANGTSAMIEYREGTSKVGKGRKATTERATPSAEAMKVLEWDESLGNWPDCPYCHHQVNVYEEGTRYHMYCGRNFLVVKKQQPTAKTVRYYGSSYYPCPHCNCNTWIDSIGLTRCIRCGESINAVYS